MIEYHSVVKKNEVLIQAVNKASGDDGIPAELFKILKNDAVKVLHSVCKQICQHLAVDKGLEKVSFHSNCKEGNAKECSNYRTIALISYTSKVVLNILQARLQQYLNHKLPDVQAGFRKGLGTRGQIASICWIIEKAREFQKKTTISALLTTPKPLTV